MSFSVLVGAAVVLAVVAAVRSTWSPCGHSMLSTMTPLGERSRGHRWWVTVMWFVAGAVLGGATFGVPAAALAGLVGALDLSTGAVTLCVVGATACALAADLGTARRLGTRRQVDENWLTAYRPWVYGLGFGWQIGTGVATYVMTAAVYLLVVLAALTGSPAVAFAVCVSFGLVRGLAVLAGRRLTDPEALRAFHRRFEALGPASRTAMLLTEVALLALAVLTLPMPGAVIAVFCLAAVGLGVYAAAVPHSRGAPFLR